MTTASAARVEAIASASRDRPEATAATGLVLAAFVFAGWAAHLFYTLRFAPTIGWATPAHIAVQSFLNVGLFIVAHDAIHGSLAPRRSRLNAVVGATAIFLYGALLWPKMRDNHHAHHRDPVSDNDPDYSIGGDERPGAWLRSFFLRYYSWRNFALMHLHVFAAWALSGSLAKVIIYFAIPAWCSALQLFVFGVFLPHRTPPGGHTHAHRSRTVDLPEWLSLLTCYHFGYHEEHHDHPAAPWWRLPALRRAKRAAGASRGV